MVSGRRNRERLFNIDKLLGLGDSTDGKSNGEPKQLENCANWNRIKFRARDEALQVCLRLVEDFNVFDTACSKDHNMLDVFIVANREFKLQRGVPDL